MSDLLRRDAVVLWHPYTQHGGGDPPLPVVSASGAWLRLPDGRQVLDGISSWWTCLHGHGHPAIVEAIATQAAALDHVHFAGVTHEPGIALAERLVALAPPGLTRVFYSDDGSTAVEAALKMTIAFHARRGEPGRTRFLALEHGYHGDTVGAMSVSAAGPFTADYGPMLFPVTRLPLPDGSQGEERCIRALGEELSRGPGTHAALIVEPLLMGAAGMRVTSASLLRELRRITSAHGVLLLADEVLTGFGRTGEMLGCVAAGIVPDLLCLSKALTGGVLPLAATLATEEIYAAFLSRERGRAFLHGHSYTGNPIACAAALASLDLLTPERIARGNAIGGRMRALVEPVRGREGVRDVRGIGPVAAIEIAEEGGYLAASVATLRAAALAHGVLLRPLGPVLYALPPLCVTDEEADRIGLAMADAVASLLEGR